MISSRTPRSRRLMLPLAAVTALVIALFPMLPSGAVVVPPPTISYNFSGNLTDAGSASTLTPAPNCPQAGDAPCNTSTGYGSDLNGDFWRWSSTATVGGGLRLTSSAPLGSTYTMALKFSFASVSQSSTGYSKIIDYLNRTSDDGFYFQNGKLLFYPGGSLSSTVYPANAVLDLITVRQSTSGRAGTFTVYAVGADKKLTRVFTYNDTSGGSLPAASGAGSILGFFFDDSVTASRNEATPSGRIYDLKVWSNTALTEEQLQKAVLPPDAPVALAAVPGDANATVSWNSVSDATGYTAVASPGGASCSVAAPSTNCTITGLANGSNYSVEVFATNANGASPASNRVTATPRTVPGAPFALLAIAGDGQASVAFATPTDGGSTITNYEYSVDGGTWTAVTPARTVSPVVVPGLTNDVSASIRLRAVNAAGAGAASAAASVTPVPPPTVPAAPTALVATPADASAGITFTLGANGGRAITNHQYSFDGGRSWTSFSPAVTTGIAAFSGLANGTAYELVLRAVNSIGAGPASDAVRFTPRTVPSSPTGLVATPGDTEATIAFVPGNNGGAAITNYEYSVGGGAWTAFSPAEHSSPVIIPGLTNSTLASIRLRAVNVAGAGAASAAVTVTPVPTPVAPSAPTDLVATPGDGSASVTFTLGADGGTSITNHEFSFDGGLNWTPFSPAVTTGSASFSGLTNGTAYELVLRAVSSAGNGDASEAVTLRPRTVPNAPSALAATVGDGEVTIVFDEPDDRGSVITNYEYRVDGGSWTGFSPARTSSPVVIDGLTNGVAASIELRAVNEAGAGAASRAVDVTPVPAPTVPAAPSELVGTPGDASATVSFTVGDDGGSAITGHEISIDGGLTWNSITEPLTLGAASPVALLSGLTNGTSYTVILRSLNAVGPSEASEGVGVTPRTVPAPPTIDAASAGGGAVTVHFTAGADGGAPITAHEYRRDGGPWITLDVAPDATQATIEGLTNGVAVAIRLRSRNEAGASAPSAAVDVTPRTKPSAPASVTVDPGPVSVTLTIVPGDDGGDPIDNWEYTIDGGITWITLSPPQRGPVITIPGVPPISVFVLQPGMTYTMIIRPINGLGAGAPSDPFTFTMRAEEPPLPPVDGGDGGGGTGTGTDAGSGDGLVTDSGSGELPYTGGNSLPLVAGGSTLMLIGGLFVAVRRRAAATALRS